MFLEFLVPTFLGMREITRNPPGFATACFEEKYFVLHFLKRKKPNKLDVTSVVLMAG